MSPLKNAKHEAVLQAYLADPERIGWRAWKAVYARSSQHAAETSFSRLLNDVEFADRIGAHDKAVAEALKSREVMSQHEVLAELSKIGRANMQDVVQIVTSDQVVEDVKDLKPQHAAAIAEITVESYQERDPLGAAGETRTVKRVKFKLHSKPQALSELRRHYEPQKASPDEPPLDVTPAPSDLDVARRIAFLLAQAARSTIAGGAPQPETKPEAGNG